MEDKTEICKNCEKSFDKVFKFCPHCGQQVNDKLTVKVLFYNTISNYFSFDARFFKSFFPLLFKPGYLARKFIDGKRLLYLHPAQMYLFVAVVFFFLFSFIQRDQVKRLDEQIESNIINPSIIDSFNLDESLDSISLENLIGTQEKDSLERVVGNSIKTFNLGVGIPESEADSLLTSETIPLSDIFGFNYNIEEVDSLIKIDASEEVIYKSMGMKDNAGFMERRFFIQALKIYKSKRGGTMLQSFYDTIPIAMFFLLPIFALILKLLFFKRGLYAHHLVFSFYFFSFLFTVFSLVLGANFIWDIPLEWDLLVVFSTFFYLFLAIKNFYKRGWIRSFFKTITTSFLFLIIVAPITVAVLGLITFLFY
ncbi:DUF3667 domain-containing protein [Saprospiraceae bacterium]|nr:DUF3667 domain-containing protein [Saprospiraceae bacterium]